MRNRYEFNIEEINSVVIALKSEGSYTVTYKRKFDEDGMPTTEFVRTYSAEPDNSPGNGNVMMICNRCETWTEISKEELERPGFTFNCNHCSDDFEDIIDEDDVVIAIAGAMEPDVYFDIDLYINDIHIV